MDGRSARPKVATYTQKAKTQDKRTQISMSRVWFEPMTPEFEQAKTIYTFDREATVNGVREDNAFQILHEAFILKRIALLITSEHCYWQCWSF